jgi:glycosyltransferase involved in cell wall biosynthesis
MNMNEAKLRIESPHPLSDEPAVAVVIPCYNEAIAIGKVVRDFKAALPHARVYVYDNNSTDDTIKVATAAGAIVRSENLQGKGNVVRRMFSDIEADVYVMVDGDDTYDATSSPGMIQLLVERDLDCVNGVRQSDSIEAYRNGHQFGNWLLTTLVARLFGRATHDMLTGYRVFTRRFVKSFPVLSGGFEIETELTVHTLEMRMRTADVDTRYGGRPAGSTSKLNTYRDGWRILKMIVNLLKQERPLMFFNSIAGIGVVIAMVLFAPVLVEFIRTGEVRRFPTAILSATIVSISVISVACGLILDTVTRGRKELKRLMYLQLARREVR